MFSKVSEVNFYPYFIHKKFEVYYSALAKFQIIYIINTLSTWLTDLTDLVRVKLKNYKWYQPEILTHYSS